MFIFSSHFKDYVLSFVAFIQPILIIVQQLLIGCGISEEIGTSFRVLTSAFFIFIAFGYILKNNFIVVFKFYIFTLIILIIHLILFPKNADYLINDSLRFLLPIVIPTALCVYSVTDLNVFYRVLKCVGWILFLLSLAFLWLVVNGDIMVINYNMSLGYGLILGSVVLYQCKNIFSVLASFTIIVIVTFFASRGPLLVFVAYVLYDLLFNKSRLRYFILAVLLALISSITIIISYFDSIGIQSRTLNKIMESSLVDSSGRDVIYSDFINILNDNPIMGIGLWGDRVVLQGAYCHNIFLEILLNFGYPIGILIILFSAFCLINLFFKFRGLFRDMFVMFFFYAIIPLMVSSSYLIDLQIGIFIGFIYLAMKLCKEHRTQNSINISY